VGLTLLVPFLHIFVLFENSIEQPLWSTMISKHLVHKIAFCAMLAIPYNPLYAAQKSVVNTVSNTYSHFLTKNILPARLLENNTLPRIAYFVLGTVAVITAKKIANSFATRITDARLKTLVDKYNAWKNNSANKYAALQDLLQEWNRTIPHLKFYHYCGDIEQYSTKWTLTSRTSFIRRVVWSILDYAGQEPTRLDEVNDLFTLLLSYIDKNMINSSMKDCFHTIMPHNRNIVNGVLESTFINQGAAVRKLLQDKELTITFHWWELDPYPEVIDDPF
jgi:hypothetical protein